MQIRPWETTREPLPAHAQDSPDDQRHAAPSGGANHATPHGASADRPSTSTPLFLADSLWSPTLAQQARESICFSKPWLDLIKRVYGYRVFSLTITGADGRFTGVLPLCSVRSPLGGRHLVALPFSDLCPLLATDARSASALVDQAIGLAQRQRARYLELRTGGNDILAARPDLAAQDLYIHYWLPLDGDPEGSWRGLDSSVRKKVNKSRKLGVEIRLARNREDVQRYYRLHVRTRSKRHGMPAQPAGFFLGLWDAFAESGALQIFLAEYRGAPVAGLVMLTSRASARCLYSASDERYLHLAPNQLIQWSAIQWACQNGYRVVDMGRVARDNVGLMDFKRHFGAAAEPLTYYYHPHVAGLAATAESSWRYRALTACWKRLPLPVAASLGGRVYRYLA